MPFSDIDLEKLYVYGRFLLKKLPREGKDVFKLGDEVSLEYYRLDKISQQKLILEPKGEYEIEGGGSAGIRLPNKDEQAVLSTIIELLNNKFQTEFTDADRLFFDQIETELLRDERLLEQAQANTEENFGYGFYDIFLDKLIARMEQNQDIFTKIMDDGELGGLVTNYYKKRIYNTLSKQI